MQKEKRQNNLLNADYSGAVEKKQQYCGSQIDTVCLRFFDNNTVGHCNYLNTIDCDNSQIQMKSTRPIIIHLQKKGTHFLY